MSSTAVLYAREQSLRVKPAIAVIFLGNGSLSCVEDEQEKYSAGFGG